MKAKKGLKKVLAWGMSIVCMLAMVLAGSPMTAKASASTSWNFKNTGFKNLGTISSTVTVDNLSLIATSSKTMSVIANSQTVDGTAYTYALALGGSGSTSYRAVKVPVSGTDTIKVTCMSSGSAARTLVVADGSGNKLGTMNAGTTAATVSYNYSGSSGYVYLYSSNSGINIYKIQVDSSASSGSGSSSSGSSTTDTSNGTVVTSFSELTAAVTKAEKAGGGIVYVKGSSISCTAQLALKASNANVSIIGVKNSDGTYPVLDFSAFRSAYIGKATTDSEVGIRISGSKYTIKNQITGGAYSNTMRFVYSYRNCDVYTLGGNADGFAPKLGAGKGNVFYGCYSWENSDDGWDSYDKDSLTYNLTYTNCACWNNGDPTIFTGEYDYNNGNALDTDLLLVELISKKDSSFASNYKKGKFSLPGGSFISTTQGTLSIANWKSKYDGNPNGFKFGSVNTTSSCVRTVTNCLAFGHSSKGFDNNNSSCTAYLSNCISYDNGYNYYMPPFTLKKFSNILSFSGASSNKLPSGYTASIPSSSKQAQIRSTVNATVSSITTQCKNNVIPGEVYFNIFS